MEETPIDLEDQQNGERDAERKLIIQKMLPKLEGWCTAEKVLKISNLVLEHKLQRVVALGVVASPTLLVIGLAMQSMHNGLVYAVEPFTDVSDYEKIFQSMMLRFIQMDLTRYINLLRLKSYDAIKLFSDDTLDAIYQDSLTVSSDEVREWAPKLKCDGFWIFDHTEKEGIKETQRILTTHFAFHLVVETPSFKVFQKKKRDPNLPATTSASLNSIQSVPVQSTVSVAATCTPAEIALDPPPPPLSHAQSQFHNRQNVLASIFQQQLQFQTKMAAIAQQRKQNAGVDYGEKAHARRARFKTKYSAFGSVKS